MKILKEGKLPEIFYRGECDNCGCIYMIDNDEADDIFKKVGTMEILCPTPKCAFKVKLDRESLEMNVKNLPVLQFDKELISNLDEVFVDKSFSPTRMKLVWINKQDRYITKAGGEFYYCWGEVELVQRIWTYEIIDTLNTFEEKIPSSKVRHWFSK